VAQCVDPFPYNEFLKRNYSVAQKRSGIFRAKKETTHPDSVYSDFGALLTYLLTYLLTD